MRERVAVIATTLVLGISASADAAQIRLTYEGSGIPLVSGPSDGLTAYPAFSGEIILDEAAFGGSVADKTLSFFAIFPEGGPFDDDNVDGIVSWDHGIRLYSFGGTTVSLTFDGLKNVTSWSINAFDGPPDFFSDPSGDQVLGGNGGTYSTGPGTWVTAQVPLPASGLGLGAAAAALIALRRMLRAA